MKHVAFYLSCFLPFFVRKIVYRLLANGFADLEDDVQLWIWITEIDPKNYRIQFRI